MPNDLGSLLASGQSYEAARMLGAQRAFAPSRRGEDLRGLQPQVVRERFGVKHMLLGPPQLATLPEEQAARLNKNLTAVFPMADGRAHPLARYPAGEEVTVQAVRECTWPSCIIVGCRSEKLTTPRRLEHSTRGESRETP